MAATVQIHEVTATNTGTDKSSGTVRFKAADNVTVDTVDRLQIPAAGSIYSYTKHLRFYVSVAPSVDLQNLRSYSDGSNTFGTGVTVEYTLHTAFSANINTTISGTDVFTKTSGATIDMDAYNTGPHTGTGYKGDNLRLQMVIASTAAPGVLAAETLTFAYILLCALIWKHILKNSVNCWKTLKFGQSAAKL